MEPWISVSTTHDGSYAEDCNGGARFEPARLEGFAGGTRFGVWWLPVERDAIGTVLCVQPLGEEQVRARHAIAAQAWRMAARGWSVLMPDLFACGDSPGEPGQATLGTWRNDLLRAAMLARQRASGPTVIWGVRAGSLLGVDVAVALDQLVDAHLHWQPPSGGAAAAQALRDRAGFSDSLLEELAELQMQPPRAPDRGRSPAALFVEAREAPATLGDVSTSTRDLAEAWLAAGYLADARAARAASYWESEHPGTRVPAAVFEATEAFLETVR